MEALATGATGKVGHAVASALLERGDAVRALVRDPRRAAKTLPEGAEPVQAPDASKAVRDLGWEPTRLDEGLRATLAGMGLA